jgi:hypothetical protein
MLSRKARILLLAGGVLAAAIPAIAQQPESLLPPGFGDPKPSPPTPEQPKATPQPTPTTPDTPPGFEQQPTRPPPAAEGVDRLPIEESTDSALTDLEALPTQPVPRFYDVPEEAVRPTDLVGVINITSRGLPIDAFGDATGAFVGTLMRRLEAPLPSRWASILLRRALMSRVTAPRLIDPVDFVAERVRLLVRMGEADAARMLVQAIDIDSYNPNMVRAAYEAALASSDPAGLCPLVEKGRESFNDPVWPMADAMCAAMAGEAARAGTLLDEARRRGARGVDLLLAEKIIGAGRDTRRSVEVQWDEVQELSLWRFGLASAAGAEVPERLMNIAGPRMQAWMARAPMVPVAQRLAASDAAASLGVFSSSSLVDAHALALQMSEEADTSDTLAARLQTAFTGADMGTRMAALRRLWEEGAEDPLRRHARLILTAGAAGQIEPSDEHAGDADEIVAALFTAGMDGEAAAWANVVEGVGGSTLGWALLAVGSPRPVVGVDGGRIGGFAGGPAGELRAQFLAAALAGLGRTDERTAQSLGVDTARENGWTRALDRAASAGQSGTVALLAAVGLQTGEWAGVPPDHLYRIVRALRQVGLEYEARMIAAEALTRL